ncbi:MAG: glutamate racemase [Bacteroidaceae bacterium]|nr:glutamate racemase [Prevotellaceae bacterium]MDY5631295.1 glutamate racemase [Bacteroidaceae bacterium]
MNLGLSYHGPIGVFDSGYGGLTILRRLQALMPQYDYVYLGDNARAPYGTRSFQVVYEFTLQAVRKLFHMGCPLVVLGCNTASAKALRTIQQVDLPRIDASRRVLGIIRPTAECIGQLTQTRHVGIMATPGTIRSNTYALEIAKQYPDIQVSGQACPMWVPLVENGEYDQPGADYFVRKYVDALMCSDPQIDTIILGCTHYPLLLDKIRQAVPAGVQLMSQGDYVARSLEDYLRRHPEMQRRLTQGAQVRYLTTEDPESFKDAAAMFLSHPVVAERIVLG